VLEEADLVRQLPEQQHFMQAAEVDAFHLAHKGLGGLVGVERLLAALAALVEVAQPTLAVVVVAQPR
jgi:hypothetical protein